jgi:hypothetical protein
MTDTREGLSLIIGQLDAVDHTVIPGLLLAIGCLLAPEQPSEIQEALRILSASSEADLEAAQARAWSEQDSATASALEALTEADEKDFRLVTDDAHKAVEMLLDQAAKASEQQLAGLMEALDCLLATEGPSTEQLVKDWRKRSKRRRLFRKSA